MTIFSRMLIVGGLFAGTVTPALSAEAELTERSTPTVSVVTEIDATGLLLKDGRLPFVLERYLKDGHMQG